MHGYYNELTQTENKDCLLLLNMHGGVKFRASDSQSTVSEFKTPMLPFCHLGNYVHPCRFSSPVSVYIYI